MSRETASQDAEFERLLRSVMGDVSASVPPTDGWTSIRSRLRQVRRRRRLRAAARVGAGLLAVSAVIGAVNGIGIDALTRHGPTPAAADKDVRGSLRSDAAWLKALRRHVAESAHVSSDGATQASGLGAGEWSPPSAGAVRVIFAGDLNGYRLALVSGDWSPVGRTLPSVPAVNLQRWFVGRAGAPVKDLLPGSSMVSRGAETVAAQTVQPGSLPGSTAAMKGSGVAVAVVDGAADVRLAGPAVYADDGTASLPLPARSIRAVEPGVYAAPIQDNGAYRLIVNGSAPVATVLREVREATAAEKAASPQAGDDDVLVVMDVIDFARPVSGVDPALPEVITPSRGGPTPPRDVLRTAFGRAALNSGLRADSAGYHLLSARPGYDAAGKVTEWTVVTAVTAPSGAHFVLVTEVPAGGRTDGVQVFPDTDPGFDAWKLVPRGSLESLALAWPMRGVNQNTVTPMGLIAILGPREAVSAEVLGPKGNLVGTVAVTGRVQGVDFDHKPLSSVRFLDSAGRTLVVTPVSAYAGGNVNAPAMSWPTSAG
jgi:hypothetical protein